MQQKPSRNTTETETHIIDHIARLRQAVERRSGMTLRVPSDFAALRDMIFTATGELLSDTTLKRVWGYIEGWQQPRRSTLNILSIYAGARNWDDFCGVGYVESGPTGAEILQTESLQEGSRIELRWSPDRKIVAEHLGESHFVVRESKGSKLDVGTRFGCRQMVAGMPLYLLLEEGAVYVAGRDHGVTFDIL